MTLSLIPTQVRSSRLGARCTIVVVAPSGPPPRSAEGNPDVVAAAPASASSVEPGTMLDTVFPIDTFVVVVSIVKSVLLRLLLLLMKVVAVVVDVAFNAVVEVLFIPIGLRFADGEVSTVLEKARSIPLAVAVPISTEGRRAFGALPTVAAVDCCCVGTLLEVGLEVVLISNGLSSG